MNESNSALAQSPGDKSAAALDGAQAAIGDAQAKKKKWGKKEKENLGFWRENIEALAVAIVMALTVKLFFFEAFKVPTESMEPAIIGRVEGGDRLIVNKFVYQLRDPRRWEIIVFQYPLNRLVNYVKRCVGMPDEWLFIRNGDIYTSDGSLEHAAALKAASIQRKPDSVQDAIFDRANLIPPSDREVAQFTRYWEKANGEFGKGSVAPLKSDGKIVFRAKSGVTLVKFKRPPSQLERRGPDGVVSVPVISNRRYDSWSPSADKPGGLLGILGSPGPARGTAPGPGYDDEVGDIRLNFEVEPAGGEGAVVVRLLDGTHGIPIQVEIAVEGSGRTSRLLFGEVSKDLDVKLRPKEWTEISVANCDDRILIIVDGDEVARHDYQHAFIEPNEAKIGGGPAPAPGEDFVARAFQPTHDLPHENGVAFGFDGGRAGVRAIELSRDLYYTYAGQTDFKIPEKSYLMCGDNSPNSLDARGFKATILEYKNDDGEVITMRGDAEGVSADESQPRPMMNPFNNDQTFYDDFGNTIELDPSRIISQKTVFAHYVHRDQIVGRAYLTFWPIMQAGIIR